MPYKEFIDSRIVNGRFVCCGSVFHMGHHGLTVIYTKDIKVHPERQYLVYISLTMLSAYGGDFDEDDTVYADIFSIDGSPKNAASGYGGVWGRHFGPHGHRNNQAVSTYFGVIQNTIRFRIMITGDNHVGAAFYILEL